MKRFLRLSTVLILIVLSLVMSLPVGASDQPSYPKSINGLPVIFVQTPDNTVGLTAGQVVLTLLDKTAATDRESAAKLNLAKYLTDNPLPKGWAIEVYGGPGASKGTFKKTHKESYDFQKKYGGVKLGPIASPKVELVPLLTGQPTFATVADDDPAIKTIDDIHAHWNAPQVGTHQSTNFYSALLNNGWTNTGYFLQSGQVFYWGTLGGRNVWADTTTGYSSREFNVAYVSGHEYSFSIWLSGTDWVMSCFDQTGAIYDYYSEPNSTGTYLVSSPNTSIFFENYNANADWYQGFTNPISVFGAEDGYDDLWFGPWERQNVYIVDSFGNYQPNNSIITGSLTSYGTAAWHLENILLAQ